MSKQNKDKYYMTFEQIANQLTIEANYTEIFTANQVKKICYKALNKLKLHKNIQILEDFY